ncbi:PREDICTED: uncharacterized protein LOC109463827 [Branchiostoma belcheri]|uniref:Uncharacterized protein LOC109463827 n=1 Tax=Branchiostoma belcheri TaxID=7741 RepID=A0A6P4XI92_BRABE|nr:PREDICTED: uncharacterized protein LOC109463827 [Branchiostoma belcheri]
MNTSLLILLCGTFGQVFGGADQDEAQLDARGPSALIDAGSSDISAGGTEDTDAEAPVSFSLNDVIHRLLQQQEEIRQLQVMVANRERTVQSFRCESGILNTNINSGSGSRHRDLTATFSRSFPRTPVVTVGLRKVDNSRDRNLRVTVVVQSVYVSHLTVRFWTWADTRLNSIGVNWMACA